MEFSIVDCMFVIHDMEHLNKQLKLKFNITCEINNDEPEVTKPEIKVQKIEVPEINIKVKKQIIKKEVKPEIKKEEIIEEVEVPEIKTEVKKGPKTPAERQRERRERLKKQLGEEEFKKQNQKKMKEYRAKQQKEKKEEEEEDENIDDDNVSTTSSNNNNKLRNEDNMITCECGMCYHKSYKSRHLTSKTHIKGLEDKEKNEQKEVMKMKIKEEGELLNNHKYVESIKFVNSIIDFDCRDNILSHENNEELYEELDNYINRFINKKCNEDQLNYDCYATIKEFVEKNDIQYNYDFFSEYLSVDPYEDDDESE